MTPLPLCLRVVVLAVVFSVSLCESVSAQKIAADPLVSGVDAAIDLALAENRIVGAVVLVSRDGELIYHRAAGLIDREANRPMTEDAIFRLASMSKTIVSAATLSLVEKGKLKLDDPVTKYLPDFRPKLADGSEPVITVRELLTHTAGLTYGFLEPEDGPYHRAGVSDGLAQPGRTAEDNLRRIASVPLSYKPGTAWGYSVAIDVLGEVIAKADGRPLQEVVSELVTGPLKMTDTAFTVSSRDRLAVSYANEASGPVRMSDHQIVPIGVGVGFLFDPDRLFNLKSFPSGGAGLNGTAKDYLTFLETLRTGGGVILKPETVAMMTSNQTGDLPGIGSEPGWQFCFGAAIKVDGEASESPFSVGTYKWGGAYGHTWFVDPEKKLSVVILTNCTIEGMAGKMPDDISKAIYESLK